MGEIWTVWQADDLLGEIAVTSSDFPWLIGSWQPTPKFEAVRHLFEDELAAVESDDWDEVYLRIWAAGIRMSKPSGDMVEEFILHLDRGKAWFR